MWWGLNRVGYCDNWVKSENFLFHLNLFASLKSVNSLFRSVYSLSLHSLAWEYGLLHPSSPVSRSSAEHSHCTLCNLCTNCRWASVSSPHPCNSCTHGARSLSHRGCRAPPAAGRTRCTRGSCAGWAACGTGPAMWRGCQGPLVTPVLWWRHSSWWRSFSVLILNYNFQNLKLTAFK